MPTKSAVLRISKFNKHKFRVYEFYRFLEFSTSQTHTHTDTHSWFVIKRIISVLQIEHFEDEVRDLIIKLNTAEHLEQTRTHEVHTL